MRNGLFLPATLIAILACTATREAGQVTLPAGIEALVTHDAFFIAFPAIAIEDTTWPVPVSSHFPSYYDWRFGTSATPAASLGVHSGEERAATASGSLNAVMAASWLRRCETGGHFLVCAEILTGDWGVTKASDGSSQRVVVTVRDRNYVDSLRAARPAFAWRSVWRPDNSNSGKLDSVRITYDDR